MQRLLRGLQGLADQLLQACYALKDWLRNDDQVTPRITRRDVDTHINGSQALTICQAYANTAKHMKRSTPEELHARIKGFRTGTKGTEVLVSYWSSAQPAKTVDALQLAERCIAEWQAFLTARQLAPPPP